MSEKKLSRLNRSSGLKADFDVIILNLSQIFAVSPDAITAVIDFLKNNNFENNLNYNFSSEAWVQNASKNHALTKGLKTYYDKFNPKREYTTDQLPFHYKDPNWMARFVLKTVKEIEPQTQLSLERVKRFFYNSPQCAKAVMQYEKHLTQALIHRGITEFENTETIPTMRKNGINEYEEMFRSKIIYAMDFLGADPHNTELTLEKSADAWRRQTMTRAFEEYFYPKSQEPTDPELQEKWHGLRDKHLEAYLRSKEAAYYHCFSHIIDEAGTWTDNMKVGYFGSMHASQDLIRYSEARNQFLKDNKTATEHLSMIYCTEKN